MNKLLDEYLCKKYPKIFVNRNKRMDESCMHWGLDVGDGWFYIIDCLCSNIQGWVDNPQYVKKKDIITRLKNLWNRTGWNWIVYPLIKGLPYEDYTRLSKQWQFHHDTFEALRFNPHRQVVADQVKEKFSGLRFYRSGGADGNDYIRGLIDMAEAISYHTCEVCGKTDKDVSATVGWITTICPECVRDGRKIQPRNSIDGDLAKIWKKISKEKTNKQIS